MKLLSVKQFHACPVGTVYRIGEPWAFGPLSIKGQSCDYSAPYSHDWMEMEIGALNARSSAHETDMLEHALANPADNHLPLDLYTEGRDGVFDDSRVVLVFEPEDINALIERLQKAKAGIDTYAKDTKP
jgi:hypothetical protein